MKTRRLLALSLPLALLACNAGRDGGSEPADTGVDVPTGPTQSLRRIEALGMLSVDGCGTATSDVEVELVFGLVDDQDTFIGPGANVGGVKIEIGDTFTSSSVQLADAFLYPAPDVPCTTPADCEGLELDAPQCVPLNDTDPNSATVCAEPIDPRIFQDSLRLLPAEEVSNDKAIFVGLADGVTIRGTNPETGAPSERFSTDPDDIRLDATTTLLERAAASGLGADTVACVVTYNGPSENEGFVEDLSGDGTTCLEPLSTILAPESAFRDALVAVPFHEGVIDGVATGAAGGDRPVFAAVREGLDRLGGQTSATLERHVIIFTDGPDTGSNPNNRAYSLERITQLADDFGARVHIVHLDNPAEEPRTGPLDEFAQVACATEGTYVYAEQPEGLRSHMRNVGFALRNRYGLRMQVPELAFRAAGAYRVSARMTVTLGSSERTVYLNGDNTVAFGAPTDTRMVIFSR